MYDLEAKDFLVKQTAEQAALDHVEFSDLEKRMMYFTESGEMREDLFKLNAAFEAEYDSTEYESKVSQLMRHAYARLKRENPLAVRTWDEAIQELSKGDHYLLVLLDPSSVNYSPGGKLFGSSFWKLLGIGLLILFAAMVAFMGVVHRGDSMPASAHSGRFSSQLKYLLLGLALGIYLVSVFLPGWVGKAWWWIAEFAEGKKTHKT